ncbi:MAG: DJ-1/PfpI family protein [Candidatus Obscuribacterales bacterium]|nr:DJ-1/PfpI family protein [Candidatus Obscuribacterales bacterium]
MRIDALLFDGFDEMDLFGVFEPLRMAGYEVRLQSLYPQAVIVGAHGLKLIPDGKIDTTDKVDLLIIPGGGWIARNPQSAWGEAQKGVILDVIIQFHQRGTVLATVCTGSLLLARAGLLLGRKATTNHAAISELVELGAVYQPQRVVDDGNIVTAAGITSSIDLGVYLVERIGSRQLADQVLERLEFERRF